MATISEFHGTSSDVPVDVVPADVAAAVRDVVRGLQDAFNAKDALALGECYARNATWTNAMGKRITGREEIVETSRKVFPVLPDQPVRYEVVRMFAIRPEVIAVNVLQTPVSPAGDPVEGAKGAPLYVVSKEADGWKIIAGMNGFVTDPAAG
ncbi:SgcJ/EcaC family oxidoreductase [Streptomyces huiliensis]|uniref:SgcJ/EcaC family oxidoreductase n=1 Tax=Streptomyces huiliensis TaxID=2876027 RepID=UPI001CBFE304|nr:SgcJ/EcaC family oxidoreductase [Streptomyces huiliensis]MBZ4320892.1 SgcJ/EcaC family oxidoreductase [Streptomyces huiliensis]